MEVLLPRCLPFGGYGGYISRTAGRFAMVFGRWICGGWHDDGAGRLWASCRLTLVLQQHILYYISAPGVEECRMITIHPVNVTPKYTRLSQKVTQVALQQALLTSNEVKFGRHPSPWDCNMPFFVQITIMSY